MKWRNVNRELPPDLQEVLFFAENNDGDKKIMPGFRKNDIWHSSFLFYSEVGLDELIKITHWMPLPQEPKYQNTLRKK